jgi:hypothetical protein
MTAPAIPAPRKPVILPVPFIPPQRPAPEATRTMAEIRADALHAACGQCDASPLLPCPDGDMHILRFYRALHSGLISGADYVAVLLDEDAAPGAGIVFAGSAS